MTSSLVGRTGAVGRVRNKQDTNEQDTVRDAFGGPGYGGGPP